MQDTRIRYLCAAVMTCDTFINTYTGGQFFLANSSCVRSTVSYQINLKAFLFGVAYEHLVNE